MSEEMMPDFVLLFTCSIIALSDILGSTGPTRPSPRRAPCVLKAIRNIALLRRPSLSFAPVLAAALLVVLNILFFGTAAQAQEVEIGPSLICDTEKQVQRFIALYDGDTRATINAVNREAHDATACGVVTTAYVRGPQLANARNKDKSFSIVQILVVGIADDDGSVESVAPAVFYSLFPIEEIEV